MRIAISKNGLGEEARRGAQRFFAFIQKLEDAVKQPQSARHFDVEFHLRSIPFPTAENIRKELPTDWYPLQTVADVLEYRLTSGLSAIVPFWEERFPNHVLQPTEVKVDDLYSESQMELYEFPFPASS